MRWRLAANLLLLVVVSPFGHAAEATLGTARAAVEQWVQTRQLVSRTKADWEAEKDMLLQSKALFERELAGLDDQMSRVSTNSGQADRERSVAEEELKEANRTVERARTVAGDFEAKLKAVLPRLPAPLLETLQPLLNRLPADAHSTKASATERIQAVVSVLNEIDKFNNAVGLFSEKRVDSKRDEVAVETVYVGLGAAYFVNQVGDFAGVGQSGTNGWEWSVHSDIASAVHDAIRIYRSERPARFVPLPATIR